jgi:hypothetical protein
MTSVPKYELNADMLRDVTQKTVQETISLEAEGYSCDGEMRVDVLIKAASENSSIESACQELSDVADSNTIREHLNEQFDGAELWEQEAQLNQALAYHIPDKMPRGGIEIAIDFHDEPFWRGGCSCSGIRSISGVCWRRRASRPGK